MKYIIVNADDFGINQTITAEIERMIEAKAVSSTTVMANGACLGEVQRFAQEHPDVSFGVHLCLSEFESLTKNKVLYHAGLTDENGTFIRQAVLRSNRIGEKEVQRAICDELNAQIDVISSLGFHISHADSHHHVHNLYPLRHIFADVLKKRGLDKIRLCCGFNTLKSKAHIIKYLHHISINRYYRAFFITTDSFYSYTNYIRYGIGARAENIVELMCHPGHPAERYRNEMTLVESKKALGEDTRLISYNDLGK